MYKVYAIIYNEERDKILAWANSSLRVVTWRYDLPNCLYIISSHSAKEIGEDFRRSSPNVYHLVLEVTDNREGWLSPETWYLFRNKELQPKA